MGAGRDCRYSGARRGIGASGHIGWLLRGVGDCYGVSGSVWVYWEAGRDCKYSGARRGIGCIMGYWGLLRGVGVFGC